MKLVKNNLNKGRVIHQTVLKEYTSTFYKPINTVLSYYQSDPIPDKEIASIQPQHTIISESIKVIKSIFDTIPPTTESIVVYRGLRYHLMLDKISNPQMHNIIFQNQFLSTSMAFSEANNFMRGSETGTFIKIIIPAGSNIIPLYDLSYIDGEEEIFLNSLDGFKFIGMEKINGQKTHVYMLISHKNLPDMLIDDNNIMGMDEIEELSSPIKGIGFLSGFSALSSLIGETIKKIF